MAWRSERMQAIAGIAGKGRRRATALAFVLAAAALVGAAEPANAQISGNFPHGYGRGGGSWPGRGVTQPPRGEGGGPVWGGGRPSYPGPGRIRPWVEPQPEDEAEVLVERPRPRPRPVVVEEEPQTAPKSRPAKKVVHQAAPAATRPQIAAKPSSPKTASRHARAAVRSLPARAAPPRAPRVVPPLQQQMPGEVVVELQPNAPAASAAAVARDYGLVTLSTQPVSLLDTTLYRFRIRDGRPVDAMVRSLGRDVRVASVQPNFIFRLQGEAAGAMASLQYSRAKLRLPEAQELATGDGVTVAVIDSGVDGSHPEIVDRVATSLSALGTGPKPDPHGTAIAGIIVAHAKLVGASPAARLVAIETFAADPKSGETRGASIDIVRAISLAVEAGVRLANLSFGGPSDPLVSRAIAAGHRRGTIFVAAAGNGGPTAPPSYPAADPNVIGVTATDPKDLLFASANRGAYVGFAAPGVDILVPAPGQGYRLSSGTSMAAAHVTGVLALIMQKRPNLTLDEARQILAASATDLGPAGPDPYFGSGLVDARRAVERASDGGSPAVQVIATVPETP
jgi:subtilisin family serine protease